ncbi:MAG: DUF4097 domain-containing protein [Actinomycetota bacterium]|nr:DUF4097 domain-containing protein [Actinomycetota bacterium]
MSFRPEDEARGEASGRPPRGGPPDEGLSAARTAPAEGGRRGRSVGRPGQRRLVLIIAGLLLLALVAGVLLLRLSYGDRAGNTSVFEDSIETGPEPVVRLTNGPGRVRIEGVEGSQSVDISAKRYARGSSSAAAKENAAEVPVNLSGEGSVLEISSEGGGGVGVDYDLSVPPASAVEVESEAGDVEVSGLNNNAAVRVLGGDVTLEDVRGSITIEAPRGDVAVQSSGTETGRAEIAIGSGDLDLEDLVIGILESQIEAGDATLSGRFSGSGSIFVETGSIVVRLPSEDARELDLETRVGEVVREDEQ